MITICATPKPFEGHIGIIQENAIKSWLSNNGIEVILLGDEKGTKEMAEKYKCIYCPDIFCNSNNVPLLDSIFEVIQEKSKSDIVCYVSADVMLFFKDFKLDTHGPFLGVGYRHDADIKESFNLNGEGKQLKNLKKHGASACDYWMFPKGMYKKFPAFTVGRGGQEGWMIWHAQKHGVRVIDMSRHIMAIHQNHDYSHLPNKKGWWESPAFKKNIDLAGGFWHMKTLRDLKYKLVDGKIIETPLSLYDLILDNPIGQWLLGLKRWLNYKKHLQSPKQV